MVDWTNPANPVSIASADPPPLDPNILVVGGAWSSYWYDGFIYESEITKGLHIFELETPEVSPAASGRRAFSNPQTQLEAIPGAPMTYKGLAVAIQGTSGDDDIDGTAGPDVIATFRGEDVVDGLAGRDTVCAGKGADLVRGGLGHDDLSGRGASDELRGGDGNDKHNGGPGVDKCVGGAGNKDTAKSCEIEQGIP